MRDLLQRRVSVPHRLHAHLRQIHSAKCVEPSIRGHDVDAGREQVHHFLQYQRLICHEVWWQLKAREVSLEEEEGLEVRRLKVDLVEFDGYPIVYAAQEALFVSTDGNGFEFC